MVQRVGLPNTIQSFTFILLVPSLAHGFDIPMVLYTLNLHFHRHLEGRTSKLLKTENQTIHHIRNFVQGWFFMSVHKIKVDKHYHSVYSVGAGGRETRFLSLYKKR